MSPLEVGGGWGDKKQLDKFTSLELGEEIQYEIDEMAITVDEKHVIYSNIYTNDIVFLDFKAKKKTRIIRGQ